MENGPATTLANTECLHVCLGQKQTAICVLRMEAVTWLVTFLELKQGLFIAYKNEKPNSTFTSFIDLCKILYICIV